MQMRKGERAARDLANVRNERYFERDRYWYYTTREGVDIGPYDSKSEAVNGCCLYINYLNTTDPNITRTLQQFAHHAA